MDVCHRRHSRASEEQLEVSLCRSDCRGDSVCLDRVVLEGVGVG